MKPISGRIDQTWVQHQLHEIRGLADEKEVNALEKALWEAVLAATALGMCENPKECARLALTSKRTLDLESPDRLGRPAALLRQLVARHQEAAKAAEEGDLAAYERIVQVCLGLVDEIHRVQEELA
jgi:hypothetical protein